MIQLGNAYGEIQIGTGDAERNVNSLASTMRRVGGTMSAAISAPLIGVAAAGLHAAAGFEQSMNTIAVVSGATESAMTSLNAKALQLGRDTSFSAGEAAQGMLELSKAGLDASQTMAAISGVLDLAAAGGLSVAQAAEISANALNAFNLPASEATNIANMLAAAANSSSAGVTDMAQALQMSSAVFASNAQGMDDLATAIALMANNGIKGSDAGTSLKTMLMRLTAPTDEAAGVMQELEIAVYNADGSMKSFQNIVGQLETATANLTAEQRNQALATVFGADAIRAANILVKEGAAGFDAMKASVNQAGAAQQVAESRMKGLAGAIAYAKGTIESTLIAAFQPLLDAIGNLIRQGADLVGMFAALPEPVRNAALAFAAVMAAAGPLLLALPAIGAAFAALTSPIGAVVIAIAALAAAWTADFGGIRTTTLATWAAIQPTLASWGEAMQGLGVTIGAAGTQIGQALETMRGTFSAVWEQLSSLFGPGIARIREAFAGLGDSMGTMAPALTKLQIAFGELWTALQPILDAMIQGFGQVAQLWSGVLVGAMVLGVNLIAAALERLPEVLTLVIEQIALTLETLATVIRESITLVTALLNGDWATAWSSAQTIVDSVLTLISTMIGNFVQAAGIAFSLLTEAIINTLTDLGVRVQDPLDTLAAYWESTWTAIQATFETVWGALAGAWGAVIGWLTGTFPTALSSLADAFAEKFTAIRTAVTQRINPILGLFRTMATWLNTTLQTAFSSFESFLQALNLPNPLDAIGTAIDEVAKGIAALPSAFGSLRNWLSSFSLPNPFANWGIPESVSKYLPGLARGSSLMPGIQLVGERGPELLISRPGDKLLTNGQTNRVMAGATAPTVNVTLENVTIHQDADIDAIAYRIGRKIAYAL